MKKILIQGLAAGALSALASSIYMELYEGLFFISFREIVSVGEILVSCFIGCLLMSAGYLLLEKTNKTNLKGALNLLICVLSFVSILGPILMTLPHEVEFPELFPGLVIPMHFLPALAFMALAPFFTTTKSN